MEHFDPESSDLEQKQDYNSPKGDFDDLLKINTIGNFKSFTTISDHTFFNDNEVDFLQEIGNKDEFLIDKNGEMYCSHCSGTGLAWSSIKGPSYQQSNGTGFQQ